MAGQSTLKTTGFLRQHYEKVLRLLKDAFAAQNAMNTELFTDHVEKFMIPTHASRTEYSFFIAKRGYTVVGIDAVPTVAQGGALTATIVKVTGTNAPVAATMPLHSGTVNLNGTANTVQTLTLTSTAADLVLASGNRIGVKLSGALTAGECLIQVRLKKS